MILASTAVAGLLYLRTRHSASQANNYMATFVENSENVLRLIKESSFVSEIDLSCLSEYQDLSLSFEETVCDLEPSVEESLLGCPVIRTDLWKLTDISRCWAEYDQSEELSDYGSIDTDEEEMSYIWEEDSPLSLSVVSVTTFRF